MLKIAKADETFVVLDVDLPVPNADADVTYTLRPMTAAIRKEIIAKHTKRHPNPRTARMDVVTDGDKVAEDLIDYVLIGWTGMLFDGQPAPCDRELKLQLDQVRLAALVERAGLTQAAHAEDAAQASFRASA